MFPCWYQWVAPYWTPLHVTWLQFQANVLTFTVNPKWQDIFHILFLFHSDTKIAWVVKLLSNECEVFFFLWLPKGILSVRRIGFCWELDGPQHKPSSTWIPILTLQLGWFVDSEERKCMDQMGLLWILILQDLSSIPWSTGMVHLLEHKLLAGNELLRVVAIYLASKFIGWFDTQDLSLISFPVRNAVLMSKLSIPIYERLLVVKWASWRAWHCCTGNFMD